MLPWERMIGGFISGLGKHFNVCKRMDIKHHRIFVVDGPLEIQQMNEYLPMKTNNGYHGMKNLKNMWLGLLLISTGILWSQKKEIQVDSTYSPFELMSSYYNKNFTPFSKKNIYIGFSMSLENKKLENVNYLVEEVLNGENKNYDINLKGGYFLGDYSMVELDFLYKNARFDGLIFKDSDTIQSKSLSRGFTIAPYFRNTVPLTANERLSFFVKTGIAYGRLSTVREDLMDTDEIERTYEIINHFRLGISPGVTFFAIENFALEVGLDVLGYELETTRKKINGIEDSRKTRHNVDFEINLFSLQLGVAYYFGGKKTEKNPNRTN